MAQQIQNPKLQVQHPKLQVQHPKLQVQHPQVQVQHPKLQVQHPQLQVQHPQLLVQHPQLQFQHPQLQLQLQPRVPTMSLIHAKPYLGQGIPIEHRQQHLQQQQQNQYLQHPYYYGEQTQPVVKVLYCESPNWYHQQDLLHQQYHQPNNQFWYSGSPYVNNPKVFYPKSAPPGIIAPSLNQHSNGAQKQTATKARSRPVHKHQSPSQSATQGRFIAGGRSFFIQKSSADCCLNRIRSVSSIENNKRWRHQSSDMSKDNKELKAVPSKEVVKPQEKINQKQNDEKQLDKEAVKVDLSIAREQSLDNITKGVFRRLFKSTKKLKTRKNEKGSNDIVAQASSSCSSAKKNGFLSRLFGGVENSNKDQSNLECQSQDPTNEQTNNIGQDEDRQAEGSKKLQASKESTIV